MPTLLEELSISFRSNLAEDELREFTGWKDQPMLDDYLGLGQVNEVLAAAIDGNTISIEILTTRVSDLEDRVDQIELDISGLTTLINYNFTYLHGDPNYAADYNESVGYTKGGYVTQSGLEYSAKADIPLPAGAFDSSLWWEVSTRANRETITLTRDESVVAYAPSLQAGITLEAIAPLPNITAGTWETVLFDTSDTPTYGITPNLANNSLTFPVEAVYSSLLAISLNFGSDVADRTLSVRFFNITQATAGPVVKFRVPLGSNCGSWSASRSLDIPSANIGDEYRLEITGDVNFAGITEVYASWVSHTIGASKNLDLTGLANL